MMKKITNKLRGRAGETITETLVALLLAALALTMLAGAIASSAKLITESREKLADYYSANEAVVRMSSSGTAGQSVVISSSGSISQTVEVICFQNQASEKTPVVAYRSVS